MMYSGFTPGLFISFCASRTLGNNSGIVTTPTAPASISWWAISTEKKTTTVAIARNDLQICRIKKTVFNDIIV